MSIFMGLGLLKPKNYCEWVLFITYESKQGE